jgi:hypothetical protein
MAFELWLVAEPGELDLAEQRCEKSTTKATTASTTRIDLI